MPASELEQCLEQQHTGHHRVAREMVLQVVLGHGHELDAASPLRRDLDDAVDEQEAHRLDLRVRVGDEDHRGHRDVAGV